MPYVKLLVIGALAIKAIFLLIGSGVLSQIAAILLGEPSYLQAEINSHAGVSTYAEETAGWGAGPHEPIDWDEPSDEEY